MKTKILLLFLGALLTFHLGYQIITFFNPEYAIKGYSSAAGVFIDTLVYGYVLYVVITRSAKPFSK